MTAVESADRSLDGARRSRRAGVVGLAVLAVVLVGGLMWAKWLPYAQKASALSTTHIWPAGAIFTASGAPGSAPSLTGAWTFTSAYFRAVWPAAVVAVLVAAGVEALLPRAWPARMLNRGTRFTQALAGGAAALPSLMCTCCTAPVTVGLRRRGTTTAASLAYWLGNPVLNPAVLVFLFLVAPWQLGMVRLVAGVLLVFGATGLVARLAGKAERPPLRDDADDDPERVCHLPARYLRSLVKFCLILVPEYVIVVFVVGWLSGWLSGFSAFNVRLGVLAVVACAVIGTLLVIPTGGEIPVVLALMVAGGTTASAGALLITLPAISLPSMVMVGRALSWRVTAAIAAAVSATGVLSGALLYVLT